MEPGSSSTGGLTRGAAERHLHVRAVEGERLLPELVEVGRERVGRLVEPELRAQVVCAKR